MARKGTGMRWDEDRDGSGNGRDRVRPGRIPAAPDAAAEGAASHPRGTPERPRWERPSCSNSGGGLRKQRRGAAGGGCSGTGECCGARPGGTGGVGSSDPLESLEPRPRLRSGPAAPLPLRSPFASPYRPRPAPPRSPPPAPPPLTLSEAPKRARRRGAERTWRSPPGAVPGASPGAAEEGAMGAGRL